MDERPSCPERILADLAAQGAVVELRNGALRVGAPPGVLSEDVQASLREHKQAIILHLQDARQVARGPLTGAQRQLWFMQKLEPRARAYTVALTAKMKGDLDRQALGQALTKVVERHASLRTIFEEGNPEPMQAILPASSVSLPEHSISPAATLAEAVEVEVNRPFDLLRGPLFRAALFRLEPQSWALVLTAHHIIIDGLSCRFLLEELAELYAAATAHQQPSLPEISHQYLDFAREQQRKTLTPLFKAQLEHWRGILSDLPPPLDLPTDFPRPSVPSHEGERMGLDLPAALVRDLMALHRRTGATFFSILLAAFKVVLWRWAGQPEVCVGTPMINRSRQAFERSIGMFVDTLVVRSDLSGEPTFIEFLERVKAATLSAFANPDVPLDRLAADLVPAGTLSGSPFFRVMFNLVNFTPPRLPLPGLEVQVEETMPGSRFDLTLYAYHEGESLNLVAAYSTELFSSARMEELLCQVRDVLRQVAADPGQPISALSLRTAEASPRLPDPARPIIGDQPAAVTALDAFQRAAKRWPENVAISGPSQWTYSRLSQASAHMASRLQEAGVRPGERVAIRGARCPGLSAALLGAMQAGAVFVILDPQYPERHNRQVLGLVKPHAVVEAHSLQVERLLPSPKRLVDASEEEVAYITFTSGTTGEPRAVMSPHLPLAHFLFWYIRKLKIVPEDRFALLSGLTHDPLLRDIMVPLAAGARVCIPDGPPAELGRDLLPWLRDRAITIMHLTPSLGRLLASGQRVEPLPDLRCVLFGADVLRPADVEAWQRLAPGAVLFNTYGATETPQIMGMRRLNPEKDARAAQVPIGRGVPGAKLLVVNPAGALAGVGELGEIRVRSPHLALGYKGDEATTRERFLADPAQQGVRQYRTGDQGRYGPDGCVEFVGRADRQVKIRGVRVEPSAVEEVLSQHRSVAAAVVKAGEGGPSEGMDTLVAFVVPARTGSLGDEGQLRELRPWLGQRLPPSHIPTRYVVMEQIPLTAHGKVDLSRLIPPASLDQGTMAPRSGLEHAIAAIWSAELGVPIQSAQDNFFELGGHSLLAAQVVGRVCEALDVDIPLRELFDSPTVAGFARKVSQWQERAPLPPMEPVDPSEQVRASPAQRRMWMLDRLGDAGPPFRILRSFLLRGEMDVDALDAALAEIESRHASLRTCFEVVAGEPFLRVLPARQTVLERCPSAPPGEWEVDLGQGPLWRVRLWPSGEGCHQLEIAVHHIAADGISMGVLARELETLYASHKQGSKAKRPPQLLQYRDFAAWQQRVLAGKELSAQQDYWRRRLQGVEPLILPTRATRPAIQTFDGGMLRRPVDPDLLRRLGILIRNQGATPFMALLSTFTAILCRYSGQQDITVGTPVGVRPQKAIAEVVGLFLNPVAIRCDLTGDPTLRELLRRVRDSALAALSNADIPFEEVVRAADPPRDRSRTPLFQVFFNMLDRSQDRLTLAGLEVEPLPPTDVPARHDLTLYAVRDKGEMELALVYNRALFDGAQMRGMMEHLHSALEALCEQPDQKLSTLPLRTPPEMIRVSDPVAGADPGVAPAGVSLPRGPGFTPWAAGDVDQSIGERFQQVARRYPQNTAIRSNGERLTYEALWAWAGGAAAAITRQAVSGGRIGLLLSKGGALFAGILGTLRAGLAYVPLDPAWPDARLADIAADADLCGIVTCSRLEARARDLVGREIVIIDLDGIPRDARAGELPRVGHHDLAYILYTTGSTGRPKGVMQTHGGVLRHIRAYTHRLGIQPQDRLSLLSTHAFDAAVMDIYAALLNGAVLCPLDLADAQTLASLPSLLRELGISVYHSTPTLFRHLARTMSPSEVLSEVRCVVLGGEEARTSDLDACRRCCGPGCWFVNGLGPTESTLGLQYVVGPGERPAREAVPAGSAVPGMRARLMGPAGEQAAIYGVGEIVLEGEAVARGYWRRPEETAAVFSAAGGDGEARSYHTGDRGRWLPGGVIEFAGRRDAQVKVRGFRVELGEIEAALLKTEGVASAVVVAREGASPDGGAALAGWVVPRERFEDKLTPDSLRDAARALLPQFMIPADLVVLDELPLTATGKIDRRSLASRPLPEILSARISAPRDEMEAALAVIFADILGREKVSPEDDFFSLGGHSLSALRLLARIQIHLGSAPPLAAFFARPTVAATARWLAEAPPEESPQARLFPMGDAPNAAHATPIYCVAPPGERAALRYLHLARALCRRRPFFALEPPLANPQGNPLPVEGMAALCLQALRASDPGGPYVLAGYSNGGIIALEMAQQLEGRSGRVEALFLLDSFPPLRLFAEDEQGGLAGRRSDPAKVVQERAQHLGILPLDAQGQEDRALLAPLVERARAARDAMDQYRPTAWAGEAHLFRAAETPPDEASLKAWRNILPQLYVHDLACNHWSLIKSPTTNCLAEIIDPQRRDKISARGDV